MAANRASSIAIALACAALGAGAAAGKPGDRRTGRAVRVPRTTSTVTTTARFCSLQDDDRGICFAPIAVGDSGVVLSSDGTNAGQTDVLEVTPNLNRCGTADSWTIRIDRNRLTGYYDYGSTLVLGFSTGGGAKLLAGSETPDPDNDLASVMYVLDADGDDRADLLADQYACDRARRPVRAGDPSHQCFEYWVAVRDRWQRGRVDQIANCTR